MKFIFKYLLVAIIVSPLSAQQVGDVITVGSNSYEVRSPNEAKDNRVIGSPYTTSAYLPSVVTGYEKPLSLKYNAYTDEMEFKLDGKEYALSKEEYPEVFFGPEKIKYIYTSYVDKKNTVSGFLKVITESETVALYLKESVSFTPATRGGNSYSSEKPATYKKGKDRYFIKTPNQIVEVPTNRRRLADLFPDKEKEISNFISSEKISLTKEADLIKLIDFIRRS